MIKYDQQSTDINCALCALGRYCMLFNRSQAHHAIGAVAIAAIGTVAVVAKVAVVSVSTKAATSQILENT